MPRSPRRSSTAFAIALFTDMVGSTAIASELGDRQWKVLQAKHHAVVRAHLRTHGGREIDTAGDGFFAVFSEGEDAIRCACAIRGAVMDLGLQVRCGLNIGQVETNDGKPTGAAIVAAARIMSIAGDGEVVVSNLLRELVPGSKIEFADAGMHELKGLEGSWHLYRVVEVDGSPLPAGPPDEELADRRTLIAASGTADALPGWGRSKKVIAGAAAFLVLAGVIAFLRARDDGGASTITPNSIGVLDPHSGELISAVQLEERAGDIAASSDAVWVTNPDAGTVAQIDPSDQQVRDRIQVGEHLTGIAVGFGAVWVVDSGAPSVSRISPEEREVVQTIAVGNGPEGVATGEGSVWVTNRFDGTVSRIDPEGIVEAKVIPVGLDPLGIVVGFGSVWVGLAGSNTVVRIDPDTNAVTQPIGVGNGPASLAVSADAVWVVNGLDETVTRIDPDTDSVVDTIEVGSGASAIAVVEGNVWAANEADGTLSQIEAGETVATTIAIGSTPQGLADVGGELWVSVRGTATTHLGGTLRIVSNRQPGSLDPGTAYDDIAYTVMHLLGDGLLAFEPVGGTNPGLFPDLATSVPIPAEGGLTYEFELRPGIRYSNGATVIPSDFRRAIERVFALGSGASFLFDGLVGASDCVDASSCDLAEGIETDDTAGTVTFHLEEPDPEFRYKLTLPPAYPVPDMSDRERAQEGVPGTGPYVLEGPMTNEGVTLIRNRHFDMWSPTAQPGGYVDRIEWTFGVDADHQVEAVAAGEADLAFDASNSDRLEELFVRFAAQTHAHPTAGTYWVSLDTSAPPFDNVDVRRAMNLAIDRDRIVELFGGEWAASPTCQQIPPNFPGYEPNCPYTLDAGPDGLWSAPDMDEAKRLIQRSGTAGMQLGFEYPPELFTQGHQVAGYFVALLKDLGYRARARSVPILELSGPDHEVQEMTLGGWFADYPASSNFFVGILTCRAAFVIYTFCHRDIDSMIDRASRLQTEDPAAAAALWASIDRAVVDRSPFLWLATPLTVDFVSEQVGNYQWNLEWGTLFNQLWVT
jgi:peptide/nickel transport system substrate-binding protein